MADKPLTKTQLAEEIIVTSGLNLSRKDVTEILDAITDIACQEVAAGTAFQIQGLVKIQPKYRAATKKRMGRNPQTGEDVEIGPKPASIVVRARPLAKVKAAAPAANSKQGKALKK